MKLASAGKKSWVFGSGAMIVVALLLAVSTLGVPGDVGCGGLPTEGDDNESDLTASGAPTPPVGEYCPSGSAFDTANCFFGKAPAGTTPFLYQGAFYYSPFAGPNKCASPARFDGANCLLQVVPSGYEPFLYQGGFYVKPNRHFVSHSTSCPARTTYDGANCLFGSPPPGRTASIHRNKFTFNRTNLVACSKLLAGSQAVEVIYCSAGNVPQGHEAFVYQNRWYTGTTPGGPVEWMVKPYMADKASAARPVCRKDGPHRQWNLSWSDEFEDKPDQSRCATSDDQLQCSYLAWWGFSPCTDAPTDWSMAGRATWTAAQRARYGGVVNLDKCRWIVYDDFNQWDSSNPPAERTNSYKPENIKIEGGLLKMVTAAEPKPPGGWDCGRQLNAHPETQGNRYSNVCPHSGATISSESGLPWTQGNSPSNADPGRRYVGSTPGNGRVEFRVRIVSAGHGMWPAVWLFVDQNFDQSGGGGELDALEFLADLNGAEDQLTRHSISSGMAWQTLHNWGVDSAGYPHTSEGVGIPVRIGEWHTYAVETEPTEVRVYLDGCLRNRIVEGQLVQIDGGGTRPFHIPKNQTWSIIIGNAASAASWLPKWYRAWGGGNMDGRADFVPTEIHVDYVRYYTQRTPR